MRFESNQSRRSFDCSFSRFHFTADRERGVAAHTSRSPPTSRLKLWQETETDEIEKIKW
jgi:hypothetical protein